jgi:hypothetical protein
MEVIYNQDCDSETTKLIHKKLIVIRVINEPSVKNRHVISDFCYNVIYLSTVFTIHCHGLLHYSQEVYSSEMSVRYYSHHNLKKFIQNKPLHSGSKL